MLARRRFSAICSSPGSTFLVSARCGLRASHAFLSRLILSAESFRVNNIYIYIYRVFLYACRLFFQVDRRWAKASSAWLSPSFRFLSRHCLCYLCLMMLWTPAQKKEHDFEAAWALQATAMDAEEGPRRFGGRGKAFFVSWHAWAGSPGLRRCCCWILSFASQDPKPHTASIYIYIYIYIYFS